MIKNRFSTWALSEKDEKILVALELNTQNLQVEIKTIPATILTDELSQNILNNWVAGEDVNFPEGTTTTSSSFTDESILPDSIKVDGKSGAIRQLQNEWSYLLLSIKLFEQFNIQLEEIKLKAAELKTYSHDLFEEAKQFWENVLEYRKEKEISQDKLNVIKSEINMVFEHLKHLKENMLKEKDENTERVQKAIDEQLSVITTKLDDKTVHFKTLMDELRNIQNHLKSQDVKREIKNILFDNIQACFEKVKTRRDEVLGGSNNSRVEGLKQVADRMLKSLQLDKKDLDYNQKKLDTANNRLEQQLREAKMKVLIDKISSKEEKLKDINQTIEKLEKKTSKPATKPTPAKDEIKVTIKPNDEETAENEPVASDETSPIEVIENTISQEELTEEVAENTVSETVEIAENSEENNEIESNNTLESQE